MMSNEELEDDHQLKRALWLSFALLVAGGSVALVLAYLRSPTESRIAEDAKVSPVARVRQVTASEVAVPEARYREVASELGVHWNHVTGSSGLKYFLSRWGPASLLLIGITTMIPTSSSSMVRSGPAVLVRDRWLFGRIRE